MEAIREAMVLSYEDASFVPNSVELDWWLWQAGEKRRDVSEPHHRVRTVYY